MTVKERCRSGFNYLNSLAGVLKKLPEKDASPRPQPVDEQKQEESSDDEADRHHPEEEAKEPEEDTLLPDSDQFC